MIQKYFKNVFELFLLRQVVYPKSVKEGSWGENGFLKSWEGTRTIWATFVGYNVTNEKWG